MVVHEQLGPVEGRAFVSVPSNPSSWNHGKYCAIRWRHRERQGGSGKERGREGEREGGIGREGGREREGDMGNQKLDDSQPPP